MLVFISWNFTLSQVYLSLIEGDMDQDMSCIQDGVSSLTIHSDILNGLLVVEDSLKEMSWDYKVRERERERTARGHSCCVD